MKKRIESIAKEKPNEEICGFVLYNKGKIDIKSIQNVAEDKKHLFSIKPREVIKAKGLMGIFHSHVDCDSEFSKKDLTFSEEWGLPFFVFSLMDNKHGAYIPKTAPKSRKFLNFLKKIKEEYKV